MHWLYSASQAWLIVPLREVQMSGYRPSRYSYYDDTLAYLDEENDAVAFMLAANIDYVQASSFPERQGSPKNLPHF